MNFTNPLMLAGLAAAVLPLVLHLVGRSRARTIDWGSLPLEDAGPMRGSFIGRIQGHALLAVRCLLIVLLALALARPEWSAGAAAEPSSAVVLVLDASPSMLHPEDNATRFELARRAALNRLGRLNRGDQAGLIVLGVVPAADISLTADLQAVASQLVSLTAGAVPADLAEGERRARAMLTDSGVDSGEILLIADRQRSAWEGLRQSGTDAATGPRLIAEAVGSAETRNAWIELVELLNPPAVVGTPARFAVRVRNESHVPRGALTLRLSFPGSDAAAGPLAVEGGGVTRVVRAVTPTAVGPMTVSVDIDPAGPPGDDARQLTIDVIAPPRVVVIGGHSAAPATTLPADAWAQGRGRFRTVAGTMTGDLGGVDVVVLNNVVPDVDTISEVESFVSNGGSLLLAPGTQTTPSAWNQLLWQDGFGLAPAVSADVAPENPVLPRDVLPEMQPDADVADWTQAAVRRYWRFVPDGAEDVVCRIGDDPFIIERPFGRGRVLVVATALDGRWTPRGELTYAGLVEASVKRLVHQPVDRSVDIGVPMELTVDFPRERVGTVLRPDGRTDRVNLSVADGQGLFRYTRTDLPGRYTIRIDDLPPADWYVRPDPSESQSPMLDDGALIDLLTAAGISRNAPARVVRSETSPTLLLLTALAVALAVETVLADRFFARPVTR
ncbi:MAG TPA: BatA domain-containing protein [Tepidisphaeraceae bacterium]